MRTVLETRVAGVNKAHAYANELHPRLLDVFGPYERQKIVTASGQLLAKIQKQVDALNLPYGVDLSVYRHSSDYSLAYTVKTCESHPNGRGYDHAYYYEVTVYVGELRGGVLTKLDSRQPTHKTDYNAAAVQQARADYEQSQKVADAYKSALYPFGEYDR